jgi:preprotein translocase subunit SecB
MADTPGNGSTPAAGPMLNSLAQYMKDFSFENPNAPRSLGPQEKGPNISINVNVNARQLAETDFEVSLVLEGSAGEAADTLFKFELTYAGIFRLTNVPQDQAHPMVMIECPRLLFPFARQIIADGVRNGGFPPLYLDPIDFVGLYQQRVSEMQGNPNQIGVA